MSPEPLTTQQLVDEITSRIKDALNPYNISHELFGEEAISRALRTERGGHMSVSEAWYGEHGNMQKADQAVMLIGYEITLAQLLVAEAWVKNELISRGLLGASTSTHQGQLAISPLVQESEARFPWLVKTETADGIQIPLLWKRALCIFWVDRLIGEAKEKPVKKSGSPSALTELGLLKRGRDDDEGNAHAAKKGKPTLAEEYFLIRDEIRLGPTFWVRIAFKDVLQDSETDPVIDNVSFSKLKGAIFRKSNPFGINGTPQQHDLFSTQNDLPITGNEKLRDAVRKMQRLSSSRMFEFEIR
ncbi:hypothetical protein B0O99DRAFT_687467 [Bisporella sp. PMI_857]|nr:hypothetical protein B0O99DRAFT_687467 [Bisporella sp. PMI_857]